MNDSIYKLNKLIDSDLVDKTVNKEALRNMPPKEWLPNIIENNIHIKADNSFYKDVAILYGMQYFPIIDAPLNSKDSIAHRIPTEILVKEQLYPFIVDGKMYVASSTPFIAKESLNAVISFTGMAGYEVIMTSHFQLRELFKSLYYLEFSTIAESKLKYFEKDLSASPPTISKLAKLIVGILVLVLVGLFILPINFLLGVFFLINIFYIYLNSVKLIVFIRAMISGSEVNINKKEIVNLIDSSLPRYTILVPLRFEANVVRSLANHLYNIDYPKDKLEIMFLVGVDDQETSDALNNIGIDNATDGISKYGYCMTVVKVPKVGIDTKPLVCNYGLRFATGDYTVIYDAEDRPESNQLKKAIIGFQKCTLDTVCLQGKLNFYNSRKNLLTSFFSLEYGMWYDFFIPGLQAVGAPVPLGGTSNHFITNTLKQAGEWDPYNVTEDADIGLRIYRNNFQTRILNTYTYEEATSSVGAWLKQRARWEKGFLATIIVHAQSPTKLYSDLGIKKFILAITVFFSNFFMPFINPLLWIITILWLLNVFSLGNLPMFIWLPAVINLVVGNLIHIAIHLIAAIKIKRYDLAIISIFIPLYWLLISLATYVAVWDIFYNPYVWRKTTHGK